MEVKLFEQSGANGNSAANNHETPRRDNSLAREQAGHMDTNNKCADASTLTDTVSYLRLGIRYNSY